MEKSVKKIMPSRIIKPHVKGCFMKERKVEFSGIVDGMFWGNFAANEKAERGRSYLWIKVKCNDPKCNAIKAVDSTILATAPVIEQLNK